MLRITKYIKKLEKFDIQIIKKENLGDPFKYRHYGEKDFEIINLEYLNGSKIKKASFVLKKYFRTDIPMILSSDNSFREIQFAKSKLMSDFKSFFSIPIIDVDSEKKIIYMINKGDELKRFGPPEIPTYEKMSILVSRLAKKDAFINRNVEPFLGTYLTWVLNLKKLFCEVCNADESSELYQKLKEKWSWFENGVTNFCKIHGQEQFDKLMLCYDKVQKDDAFFKQAPYACQHGDFFFSNIGFEDDMTPVVIDWENVCYGPIGFDYATLLDGMPKLDFAQELPNIYLEYYNYYSEKKIDRKYFDELMLKLSDRIFFFTGVIDNIMLAYSDDSSLPETVKAQMRKEFIERVDTYFAAQ